MREDFIMVLKQDDASSTQDDYYYDDFDDVDTSASKKSKKKKEKVSPVKIVGCGTQIITIVLLLCVFSWAVSFFESLKKDMEDVNREDSSVVATNQEKLESVPAKSTPMYATAIVNIRSKAGTDSEILGKLNPSEEISVISSENGWSKVSYNGKEAYISSNYLSNAKPNTTSSHPDTISETPARTQESASVNEESSVSEPPSQNGVGNSYQSVLDEYTQKIIDMTPNLVNEYNSESASLSGDINALAKLCNDKVSVLAGICNDGISEMAKIKLDSGDDYSVYEEWAGKLQDVYMEYANQIQDAYLNSAS